MIINYKNKKIRITVEKASGLGKVTGLMFKKKTTENLLFDFRKRTDTRIHSYFVFFHFLAIWINEKNEVIEWKMVRPFILSMKPKKSFMKLIEIPLNEKNKKIIEFFVGGGKV